MPINLGDFDIQTLQDRGAQDLNIYIQYSRSKVATPKTGYFIAQGVSKSQEEVTLSLYYMIESGFQVQSNPPTRAEGAGFVLLSDVDGPGLIPMWWRSEPGNYSGVSDREKQSIIDFFTLITTDTPSFGGGDYPDGEDIADIGEEWNDIDDRVEEAQDELAEVDNYHDPIEYPQLAYEEVPTETENVVFVQLSMVNTNSALTGGNERYTYTITVGLKNAEGDIIESNSVWSKEYTGEGAREVTDKFDEIVAQKRQLYEEAEEERLRNELTEEVTEEEIVEEWDKNTRWLLSNSASPITRVEGPNGDYYWLQDGDVLELEDNDIDPADSGSVYFKVPEFMEIDLRLTTSSNSWNKKLEGVLPPEWVNPGGSSTQDIDETEKEFFGSDYPGGNRMFQIPMRAGDKLSVDVDAEDANVTQFRLVVGGEEYTPDPDQDETIDDEVYINISNPTIRYTLRTTTVTNGLGEVVEVREEKISPLFDEEQNKEDRKKADDDRDAFDWSDIKWGWVIGVGLAVVIGGILLFRAISGPKQATAPAPPVVVVKE